MNSLRAGTKIKGTTEYYKGILEAEIQEIRLHMANVIITKAANEYVVGQALIVPLNDFEVVEVNMTREEKMLKAMEDIRKIYEDADFELKQSDTDKILNIVFEPEFI